MRRPVDLYRAVDDLYKPCKICGGDHFLDAGKTISKKANEESQRIAKELYDGTFQGTIDPKLTGLIADHLTAAVVNGFGSDFADLEFGGKDYKMLANLEKNVYNFSAAKNYQQLKEMTSSLKDAEGNIRSFPEFKKEVNLISEVYNNAWLNTEYNTALNGSTLAARWAEFEDNKDIMPLLQYETVGDDRVREEHAAIDGVIRPVDDDFWDTWFPPNGYNCRCTVNQLTDGTETEKKDIQYPDIPKMFQTNLAKQELVFPKGHPYFDMPKKDKKEVLKEAETLKPDRNG